MSFLGNIESELQPTNRSMLTESHHETSKLSYQVSNEQTFGHGRPDVRLRERMLELELEREEQAKALEMHKLLRQREREELVKRVDLAKEEGNKTAEQVKREMAERVEKQVKMIEDLL